MKLTLTIFYSILLLQVAGQKGVGCPFEVTFSDSIVGDTLRHGSTTLHNLFNKRATRRLMRRLDTEVIVDQNAMCAYLQRARAYKVGNRILLDVRVELRIIPNTNIEYAELYMNYGPKHMSQ